MSWNVSAVGNPEDVANQIQKDQTIPEYVRSGLATLLKGITVMTGVSVYVETDGHFNPPSEQYSAYGYANVKVKLVLEAKKAVSA